MDTMVFGGRLILASVFAVAAVAKLADPEGSRRSLRDFRVPDWLIPAAVILLPLLELITAAALLTASLSFAGAALGLAVLLLFIGGMAHSLWQGRHPPCHCFGQLHSGPVGVASMVRNVVLIGIAAGILLAGPDRATTSAVAWLVPLPAFQRAVIAGGVAIIALLAWNSVLLGRLLRLPASTTVQPDAATPPAPIPAAEIASHRVTVPEVAGHPEGSMAPEFSLSTVRGDVVQLHQLRQLGKPVVLFFSDPACGPCTAMMAEVVKWQREYESEMTLVVVSRRDKADNSETAGITWLLLQNDREVANAYGLFGTPSAVRINVDGTLATRLAQGEIQIRELIAATRRIAADAADAAPAATLPEHARPVKADGVEDELMSDGTIVLYNASTNQVLTLNGTAALVWEYCDGEHDVRGMAGVLKDLFPDTKAAEADVRRLLDSLLTAGMILPGTPTPTPAAAAPERS